MKYFLLLKIIHLFKKCQCPKYLDPTAYKSTMIISCDTSLNHGSATEDIQKSE